MDKKNENLFIYKLLGVLAIFAIIVLALNNSILNYNIKGYKERIDYMNTNYEEKCSIGDSVCVPKGAINGFCNKNQWYASKCKSGNML